MNPSTALATVLVDELVRGGVREVVLCPGSRSAPLAYATREAERVGRLRLHVRVDERSAGFLALGLAKGSGGSPAAVVTTSGTAVANLHPAVLEAHHAGVPLVVLSADRPHELRGTGANQTTMQPGLFGGATRFDADLPAPDREPVSSGPWRTTVCRALIAARGLLDGDPGPVHLDVGLREPLVPDGGAPASAEALPLGLTGRADGAPWVTVVSPVSTVSMPATPADRGAPLTPVPPPAAAPEARATSVPVVDHLERTLVVVGDGVDTGRAVAWARGRGYPVVAEPFGPLGARAGALPHGPLLLAATDWLDEHLPDRVLVVGRVTLARPVAALLRRPGVRVEIVTGRPTWADATHVASAVHPWSSVAADLADIVEPAALTEWTDVTGPADLTESADGVEPADVVEFAERDDPAGPTERTSPGGAALVGDWARAWGDAGRRLAEAVAALGFPWPSGLAVADVVTSSIPDDAALVLGSSNPVRDVDLAVGRRPTSAENGGTDIRGFGQGSAEDRGAGAREVGRTDLGRYVSESLEGGAHIFVNRGLAGIDGMVSTAVGVGLARGGPTVALLGDLTFLHDTNGLLIGPHEPRPDLVVVVVNDDGGGIFTTLEPGAPAHAPEFERLFGTATGAGIAALCRAHGIRYDLVGSREQLATLVAERSTGIRVAEVRVDRAGHRAIHAALRDLAARTLTGRVGQDDAVVRNEESVAGNDAGSS
ncbi:MAG: 2-succinyl-5-enolpyruvyl-6-hydroxy-3-cyclohexene-1-carboxylic-acid synthase [Phycicoccus sp.]